MQQGVNCACRQTSTKSAHTHTPTHHSYKPRYPASHKERLVERHNRLHLVKLGYRIEDNSHKRSMEQSNSASGPPAHTRRTSEPSQVDDRRMQFERHWSTSRLLGAVSNNASQSDSLGHWQTWATTDDSNVFGVTPTVVVERPEPLLRREISNTPRVDDSGLSSVIHDAARITDWDQVLKLCKTEPRFAQYAGRDGWTALHHACNRRIPHAHVAEALIHAFPGQGG
jgi:hypothetical protein